MKANLLKIVNKEVRSDANYLRLYFTSKVKNKKLEKLLELKRLRHLNASGSYLLDQHLEIIGQIETLELLDLDLTEITDSGLQYLNPLKNFTELRLKDNPQLTDYCVEHLSSDLEYII